MGSPKALLQFGAQTFLNKIISDYRRLYCQPIIVVAGKDFEAIEHSLTDPGITLLQNRRPERGPFSSLRLAVKHLAAENRGFFIHPVDHPGVRLETLQQILNAWSCEGNEIVKPTYKGRGGHPILLGRKWAGRILRAPISTPLRTLLKKFPEDLRPLAIADKMILLNVNHPDDLKKFSLRA